MAEKKTDMMQEELVIPAGISASIDGESIVLKKDNKEIIRKLNNRIQVKITGDKILLSSKKTTKREKKILYSIKAHIKNGFEGLTTGFKYRLQAASVHFPMTLEVDKANRVLLVKNFLGEKKPRVINIIKGVDVKVTKDVIEVECSDIEKAGQVAANIEKGTKIRCRDRRVFQDGIFITEKPGVIFI